MTDREFWSANDLQERWNVSRAQTYRFMEKMPRVKLAEKIIRVRFKDVLAFEKKQFVSQSPSSTESSPQPSISSGQTRGAVAALRQAQMMRSRPAGS